MLQQREIVVMLCPNCDTRNRDLVIRKSTQQTSGIDFEKYMQSLANETYVTSYKNCTNKYIADSLVTCVISKVLKEEISIILNRYI